ncbi:hypothetical protein DCS_07828 [Drechmeria coniospora]|uniref:Uncharacterized protein n=1 Tax=Drechmeria coniospora TaxID=98403 RepID=A0A151GFI7_DRECN|nr:hypothetical protein DCS_07828 [Drechmeria coniospora]KYK55863.1 hypothetical protein DCS_07828 [Drechmeria coniospora]ODA81547.1 hypothetical protein RJ55_00047 [Drechmeria coniospora]
MSNPLFGIVPAGLALITEPTSMPSQTSFTYALPTTKSFSHIVIFLLPNVTLPENTAAAIYIATANEVAAAAQTGAAPNFRFLGGIGPGKESAMFKVGGRQETNELVIGVSVEPAETVSRCLQELAAEKASNPSSSQQPATPALAQLIIQNAFNFLASFSGTVGPEGIEVVPLKAFEEWWRKFEARLRSDPTFLEKPPS